MHIIFSLTVAESKRLIAKGVAQADFVCRAMENGIFTMGSGTTNGYLYEEITGETIDKMQFVTGRTLPSNYEGPELSYTHPDLVIRKGERVDLTMAEALEQMDAGDILVKGVNALNYDRNQAGVLIGHPTGGDVGAALGSVISRRICYLHPVGLEKNMSTDLHEVADRLNRDPDGKGASLWVVPGVIFTEIEALQVLAGVEALHISSGGVGGAEGAVWLALFGRADQLDKAQKVVQEVLGEAPFTEA